MSTEANKAVVRRYFEEFHNQRQQDILDTIIATDLREPTSNATARVRQAFPDYQITVTEMIAEGENVATIWIMRGTHQGEWMSPIGPIPPTGKTVNFTGTTTLRIAGGKISEVIGSNWDHLGILQQIDVLATSEPRSGA